MPMLNSNGRRTISRRTRLVTLCARCCHRRDHAGQATVRSMDPLPIAGIHGMTTGISKGDQLVRAAHKSVAEMVMQLPRRSSTQDSMKGNRRKLMNQQHTYGVRKEVDLPYEKAVEAVTAALKEQGFGVLSEIDMKEKLKEKLDVDYKRYVILGACNPPLAYKALQAEPEIGLLLPCNVIVYEIEGSRSVVSAADPEAMLSIVGDNPAVAEVARDAKARLSKALDSIG